MTSVTIGTPELHIEDPDVIGRRWRTGVLLLILADASFVAALIFSYFYLRGLNVRQDWVFSGQATAAIWVGWAIAIGAVLSAGLFAGALRSIRAGDQARFVGGALLALVVLIVDAVGQALQLSTFPFGVADSAYSSAVYTMAGANLFHLALTLFLAVAMWNRGRRNIYSATSNWQVQLVSIWWAWIALAAILGAFATSFITSPG